MHTMWTFEPLSAQIKKNGTLLMRSTERKITLANETHQLAPNTVSSSQYWSRVIPRRYITYCAFSFTLSVLYAGQMSQNHHICIIRLAVKYPIAQFSFQRRYSTTPARSFGAMRSF